MNTPRCQIPYIAKTKGQAKRILWLALQKFNEDHGLGIKFNRNELIAEFPNGSLIDLLGSDDEGDVEKLRGGAYPLAVLDEAQSFRGHVSTLIEDILEPAMLDYKGVIVMTGTPNALCSGYFFDNTTINNQTRKGMHPNGWSVHTWSVKENPYIPHAAEFLADKRERLGPDNPTYLREWEGKWVYDGNAIIFKLNPDINVISSGNKNSSVDSNFVLGVDLGYTDSTAFVVFEYTPENPGVTVVESYKRSQLIPSVIAAHVEALTRRYDFESIVADTGGLGKPIVEEMIQRYGLPIKAAEKRQKLAAIELLNGDLRNGNIKIVRETNGALLDEIRTLQWNERRNGPMDKDDDHLADAFLYGWRECKSFAAGWEENDPLPGTPEYWAKYEEGIWADAEKKLENASKAWWDAEFPEHEDYVE